MNENEAQQTTQQEEPATIDLPATTAASVSALMPAKFGERYIMAKVLARSNLMPASLKTPEQITVALQWGFELGLSPMVSINNISVVNGKPTLSTDIMHAIVRHNKEYGGVKWIRQDATAAECIIYRKTTGYTEEVRGVYTIEDAAKAGLTGKDNWKKYPARMLKHRALSYALRDAFPDALAGIYDPEELEEDKPAAQVRNITPPEELAKAALNTQRQQQPQQAPVYATEILNPDEVFGGPND